MSDSNNDIIAHAQSMIESIDTNKYENKLQKLKDVLSRKTHKLKVLPNKIEIAKYKYYNEKYGPDHYKYVTEKRVHNEVKKEVDTIKRNDIKLKVLSELVSKYNTTKKYRNVLVSNLDKLHKQNRSISNDISFDINELDVSNRKVEYEVQEIDRLVNIQNKFKVIFWFIFVLYCILFINRRLWEDNNNIIILVLLILIPLFGYKIIMYILIKFKQIMGFIPNNVYITDKSD